MRITHVFWGLSIGGIETMLVNIANCQARAGARVSVIIINDLNEPMLLSRFDQAVEVIRLGRRLHSLSPNFAFRLNAELRRLNPDAIHLHRSEISCFIARRWRSRLHSTVHGLTGGRLRRRGILGRMFPLFNFSSNGNVTNLHLIPRVFSISETVRADLLANYGIESRVVANGITTAEFLRRDGHAPGRQMKIVQVSRLDVATKGQDLLVEAAAMLPDVSVDFIGEGPGRKQLEELIARHGVGDRVRLLGKRDQSYLRQHLRDYDLFVQPSRNEGFALTVAEAMAAGVPVAVSAGQGPAEVTMGDTFGNVFANGDARALAAKISDLKANYGDALEKAERARNHVIENYDVDVTARRYLSLYGN